MSSQQSPNSSKTQKKQPVNETGVWGGVGGWEASVRWLLVMEINKRVCLFGGGGGGGEITVTDPEIFFGGQWHGGVVLQGSQES